MKLKYIKTPADLGGTAISGCGTIHQSEIKATLTKLSDDLEMPFNFNNYILGSTGKREYSGDIDLVVDDRWWGHGIPAFRENLEEAFGKENVARNGNMLHLRFKIVGYNPELNHASPRTGFVQIDFNFGNYEWEHFYHHSPGEESGYKGAHRNLAMSAILSTQRTVTSNEYDSFARPIQIIRWKWGTNGLLQVIRSSKKRADGLWAKAQEDVIIDGPYVTADWISEILFPEDGKPEDLNSLETIMAAVKRNYGMVDQERIWKRTAHNFSDWNQGKLFEYPPEIESYFQSNDK
jgi:hypothetical protein